MGTLKFKWSNDSQSFYTVPEDATEYTLHTNKKMMKDHLVAINDDIQSYTIDYAGLTTGEQTESYTLNTAKKMMAGDITGSINNKKVDNFITFSSSTSFQIGGTNKTWGFSLSTGVQYKTPTREWTTCRTTPFGSNYYWGETITATYDSNTGLYSISFRATGFNNKKVSDGTNSGLFPITTNSTNQTIDISGNLESLIDYQIVENKMKPSLAVGAFKYAFYNSKITSAENLVFSDTVNNSCYESMFGYCSRLTKPPQQLPAKELKQSCYYRMFYSCTSLTTPPQLPATTLAQKCYYEMFYGCSLLNKLVSLPVRVLETECYSGMFQGCKLILIADLSEPTLDYPTPYRIPSFVTGTTASSALTNMFMSTGGSFKGTPVINTTYYTSNEIITV